jgi:enoyl-CoA hydratase/carnithine racemase
VPAARSSCRARSGSRRAKEIVLTGKPFSAQDALEWGVVNKLCAPEKLMEETLATAQAICDNAPVSVRQAKRSMHFGMQMDIRSALFFEIDAYNKMVSTEDRHEGVRAFNEKRKAEVQREVERVIPKRGNRFSDKITRKGDK